MENIDNQNTRSRWKINAEFLPLSAVVAALIIGGALIYRNNDSSKNINAVSNADKEIVIPSKGVELPIVWGDLGAKMVESGIIDKEKFDKLYDSRGGLSKDDKELAYGIKNEKIKITKENAPLILNLLWAFGLSNKNEILENGPMKDKQYGGADKFASTGGWTLSKEDPMKYYSKYSFVSLTPEQQALVKEVSKNIYRPCCGNSTHFPDCNHGMAMLGLLEIMASQGVSKEEMYKVALKVNSYWFPDTYLTLMKYFETKGKKWNKIDPKEILGINYSSAMGYKKIISEVNPVNESAGGSCGA
jgi:hypothetical protein